MSMFIRVVYLRGAQVYIHVHTHINIRNDCLIDVSQPFTTCGYHFFTLL